MLTPARNWRRCRSLRALAGLVAGLCVAGWLTGDAAAAEKHFDKFKGQVAPLLTRYCGECHSGADPTADVAFDKYDSEVAIARDRKQWSRALEMVETGEMPPEDQPQPTAAEREALVAWVRAELARVDCSRPAHPGRVTIRRLNAAEYNNTVRDLLGVDFRPADDFPSDDVGYGFDNIGDVLSLPPILFEKYLDAAEKITAAAIVVPSDVSSQSLRYSAMYLNDVEGRQPKADRKDRLRLVHSNGTLAIAHRFPHTGEYVLKAHGYGQQAGPDPVRISFGIDGQDVGQIDITATEKKAETYEVRARVEAGVRQLSVAFINDYFDPDNEDPSLRGDRNLILERIEVVGPTKVELPPLPPAHRQIIFVQPGAGRTKADCARQIAERFALRAYRRPPTKDEIDRLVAIFKSVDGQGEPFERSIQVMLQGALIAPQFLFRIEQDLASAEQPDEPYLIHEYDLATRLSYFLWSSTPDEQLLELAGRGQLRARMDEQVERMLADPKSSALVENFASQWLQLRNLAIAAPDPRQFRGFTERLRADMLRETELFFEHIVREDRSVLEFLDADYTFVNERLARHYGIEGVRGDAFRRVQLSSPERGGVLTHASVLTVTSNPTRTSPVKRGKWILETILGAPPPPPPPNVPELEEEAEAALTGSLRQRFEAHRANAVCASCHSRMDPLGFGFENFDAIGRWRTLDGKFEIDPSGTLPTGESFAGPAELKQILVNKREQFTLCLAEKMLTYALGRGLEYYDQCAIEDMARALESGDYRFSSLVRATVHSRPFQMRSNRVEGE